MLPPNEYEALYSTHYYIHIIYHYISISTHVYKYTHIHINIYSYVFFKTFPHFAHVHRTWSKTAGLAAPLAALSSPLAQPRAALGESAPGSLGGGIAPTFRGDLAGSGAFHRGPIEVIIYWKNPWRLIDHSWSFTIHFRIFGVFRKWRYPNSWMVFYGSIYKMDDSRVYSHFGTLVFECMGTVSMCFFCH